MNSVSTMTSHPFIAGMIITCPSPRCGYALYEVTRWALTEDLLDDNQNFVQGISIAPSFVKMDVSF